MLVFTIPLRESFFVGAAQVTILPGGRDGQVRVGVEAPREIEVDRRKVRLAKERHGRIRKR